MKTQAKGLWKVLFIAVAACLFFSTQALSCGIEGTAVRTDGSKINNTATVSTIWNSNKAFPKDGYYTLELGELACDATVEVFVNGYSIGKYKIPKTGNATVNITLKGTSDVPVGR